MQVTLGFDPATLKLMYTMAIIAIILLLIPIIVKIVNSFIRRIIPFRDQSLMIKIQQYSKIVVVLAMLMFALSQLGLETTILAVIVALAAFSIILAFRDIILNLGGEYYIKTYQPFKIGDLVDIGGCKGRVVDIGSLATTIETTENERVVIPNSFIARNYVINKRPCFLSIPISVDNNKSINDLIKLQEELANKLQKHLTDKPILEINGKTCNINLKFKENADLNLAKNIINEITKPYLAPTT
ncbi:MAG: mechanosensitive ion channel [Candidatus Methanomethylicia archaeon]